VDLWPSYLGQIFSGKVDLSRDSIEMARRIEALELLFGKEDMESDVVEKK